jgi:hypothetical protein
MPRIPLHDFPNLASIIQPGWVVVDYGGGTNPSEFSHVVVDIAPTNAAAAGKKVIVADCQSLRGVIADKQFDFVIASHVAEHVENPIAFCRELVRTAKMGYIETPAPIYEAFFEWSEHKWMVETRGDALCFRAKTPENCPGRLMYDALGNRGLLEPLRRQHEPLLRTRFLWQDDFRWIVEG